MAKNEIQMTNWATVKTPRSLTSVKPDTHACTRSHTPDKQTKKLSYTFCPWLKLLPWTGIVFCLVIISFNIYSTVLICPLTILYSATIPLLPYTVGYLYFAQIGNTVCTQWASTDCLLHPLCVPQGTSLSYISAKHSSASRHIMRFHRLAVHPVMSQMSL